MRGGREKKLVCGGETEYGRSIYIGNGGALQTTPGTEMRRVLMIDLFPRIHPKDNILQ